MSTGHFGNSSHRSNVWLLLLRCMATTDLYVLCMQACAHMWICTVVYQLTGQSLPLYAQTSAAAGCATIRSLLNKCACYQSNVVWFKDRNISLQTMPVKLCSSLLPFSVVVFSLILMLNSCYTRLHSSPYGYAVLKAWLSWSLLKSRFHTGHCPCYLWVML